MTPHIRLYPDALDGDACKELIRRFEASNDLVHRGRIRSGVYAPNYKRCWDLVLSHTAWKDLDAKICGVVRQSLDRYYEDVPTFHYGMSKIGDTGYLMQKYNQGGEEGFEGGYDGFDWHSDTADLSSSNRLLALIIYLNDVERGGETEFMDKNCLVKPKEGSLLWFPANFEYTHRGKTPLSGPKYILTSFLVYSP